jgi:peptide/nickel transport system permease protein
MGQYTIRRVLLIFPTLIVASLLLALMLRLLPGDVIAQATGGIGTQFNRDPSRIELVKGKLGLDKPFWEQYIRWIVGWPKDEGAIYRTTDGGETWRRSVLEDVKPFSGVSFLTPTMGWGIRENMIFQTRDGGTQWSNQHLGSQSINSVYFGDENVGWAVGNKGTVLHTTEGGKKNTGRGGLLEETWQPVDTGANKKLTDVLFVGESRGWITGDDGTLLFTGDGGVTWTQQDTGTNADFTSIEFADESEGVVVGSSGTILATTDGGSSWFAAESGTESTLNSVSYASPSRVWAVGDSGTVLRSDNGGLAWSSVVPIPDLDSKLSAVDFGNEEAGVIVGDDGVFLITGNGGATWDRRGVSVPKIEGDKAVETPPIEYPIRDLQVFISSSGKVRAWAPAIDSFWDWGILGGNLGERFLFGGKPVMEDIRLKLGPSMQLMLMSVITGVVLAIPIGVFSAVRQDTWGDFVGRSFAIGGLAIPSFWLALMVILVPSYWLGWVPPLQYVEFFENPGKNLYFFMLPSLVASLPVMAEIMRLTRSMMLEVMRQDYMRTAFSKGLRARMVIFRHALKNALIPVVTMIGLLIPYQLGQLVIIERVFNVPGLGRLMFDGIGDRDLPLIQGLAMFLGLVVVVLNLLVDLVYSWLDPRIRYE